MDLYLLSCRNTASSVSCDPVYELENLIASTCNATILAPSYRPAVRRARSTGGKVNRWVEKAFGKTIGRYEPVSPILPATTGPKVLLVITICGADLSLLSAIKGWRQQFDCVAAYVFDAWGLPIYPSFTQQLDHLFVPMPELITSLHQGLNIPVSFLPFGVDALCQGSIATDRPIDVISYGRIPQPFHNAFAAAFNQPQSSQLYYRATPRRRDYAPALPYEQREDQRDRQLFFQLLRRTKLALAFDTLYPGMREFPYSFVTLRWFEGAATGCTIIGKRPTTPVADELLNWEDATIEIPDDPLAAIAFVQALLADSSRLETIRQRNYWNALAQHDWRWRIQQIFQTLNLPIPHQLAHELKSVEAKIAQLSSIPALVA